MLQFNSDSNTESYDPTIHCKYCGCKLKSQEEYCSKSCKEKDSVWHTENDY